MTVAGTAAGLGGTLGGYLVKQVFRAVDGGISDGTSWLLHHVGELLATPSHKGALSATTEPLLSAPWFSKSYRGMVELAAVAVLVLLLVSLMHAIVRQDLGQLARSTAVQVPVALLVGAAGVELVRAGTRAVDALCLTVAGGAGSDMARSMQALAATLLPASLAGYAGVPLFVAFVALVLLAFGALLLWLELVVRAAAIEVAVLFLPLVVAGLVWPVTARWARRLTETLAALVLAKLVIVAVLVLAASAVAGPRGLSGIGAVVQGTALLMLATLSPFALLRLLPMIEAGAVGHLEGAGRGLGRRVASPVTRPARMLGPVLLQGAGAQLLGGAAAAGAGDGGEASGTGPTVTPGKAGVDYGQSRQVVDLATLDPSPAGGAAGGDGPPPGGGASPPAGGAAGGDGPPPDRGAGPPAGGGAGPVAP
ncbi:MAG: hypothetical protein ACRDZQ_04430, partial [Acidimicrobiales bacterium]